MGNDVCGSTYLCFLSFSMAMKLPCRGGGRCVVACFPGLLLGQIRGFLRRFLSSFVQLKIIFIPTLRF